VTAGQIWLVLRALLAILPTVALAVREGRIRVAAEDAVLAELQRLTSARAAAAKAAKADPAHDKKEWQRD
jgi:hypothetical protein